MVHQQKIVDFGLDLQLEILFSDWAELTAVHCPEDMAMATPDCVMETEGEPSIAATDFEQVYSYDVYSYDSSSAGRKRAKSDDSRITCEAHVTKSQKGLACDLESVHDSTRKCLIKNHLSAER